MLKQHRQSLPVADFGISSVEPLDSEVMQPRDIIDTSMVMEMVYVGQKN
jgi:hypothetical protein